jgi:sec-independent protein translocase protein TatC
MLAGAIGKRKKPAGDRGNDQAEMTFLEHLEELRWRLIKSIVAIAAGMFIAFPFSPWLIEILTWPNNHIANPPKLIFLKPAGMLMVRMGVSIAAGIIMAFPVVFYQMWKFISPGLLPKEKRIVAPVVGFSFFSFLLGVGFAYFIMIPFILPFLYGLATENIEPTINISEYIGFVLRIILVTGLVFELPLVSFFLTQIGVLKPQIMRRYRRYAVVTIFVLAAILTPPDPGSQLLLAGPLLVLYEISIWVSHLVYRRKKRRQAEQMSKEEASD